MQLYFMGSDDMLYLKKNMSTLAHHYKEPDNGWLKERLGHEPFIPFRQEFDPFTLDPEAAEVENVKKMYPAMKALSDSDATDERLWTGMTHGLFWSFMNQGSAFATDSESMDETYILNHYFLNVSRNGLKRSRVINRLSKLWWTGRLTYDESRPDNPFASLELFRTAFSHKLINTFSSNFMANPHIRFALFDAGLFLQKQGIEIKGDTLVPLNKYLNEVGGTMILDAFSREELSQMLIDYSKNLWLNKSNLLQI